MALACQQKYDHQQEGLQADPTMPHGISAGGPADAGMVPELSLEDRNGILTGMPYWLVSLAGSSSVIHLKVCHGTHSFIQIRHVAEPWRESEAGWL